MTDLTRALEAVLFVSAEPAPLDRLRAALDCEVPDLEQAARALAEELASRGLRLQRSAEGLQLVSAPDDARQVEKFLRIQTSGKLSSAALETLAIVAYRQPVHRLQIEEIRGVSCERALRSLIAQELVQEVGRATGIGRPVLYGTTTEFLQRFGLESLASLPPLES
ncbi:MAG: SMC-Scp complex subunit ScpB [Chloroflexota bacterium]